MKKFYEQPVVEITAFDVEDIMTTSGVALPTELNTASLSQEDLGILSSALKSDTTLGFGANGVKTYNSYNW